MVLLEQDILDILEGNDAVLLRLINIRENPKLSLLTHCKIDAFILQKLRRRDTYRYKFNKFVLHHRAKYQGLPVGNCLPYGWDENGAVDHRFHKPFRIPDMGITLEVWTMENPSWDVTTPDDNF